MSVSITARKMIITSEKLKNWGLKMPLRATSIMPLAKVAPSTMPMLTTMRIVRREATLDPRAELRKLTASLLTPTMRSETARVKRRMTIRR